MFYKEIVLLFLLMQMCCLPCHSTKFGVSTYTVEGTECTAPGNVRGECLTRHKCNNGLNGSNSPRRYHISSLFVHESTQSTCTRQQVCCPVDDAPPSITSRDDAGPEDCGIRQMHGLEIRITGKGKNVVYSEFPWMVALFTRNNTYEYLSQGQFPHEPKLAKKIVLSYACGGSLIHLRVVLTAAHCVALKGDVRVRAGDWDLDTLEEAFEYQERMASRVIVHNEYDSKSLQYDVALLILERAFDKTDNVGMICLPPASLSINLNAKCVATGWGMKQFQSKSYERTMKVVELPLVDQYTCQNKIRDSTDITRKLHDSFICAGGNQNEDTCKGDGGSPLVCEGSNNRYFQLGIVSWGIGCGNAGVPGVYANVIKFRQWIDDKMLANGYSRSSYSQN